jgi:hypothetical protein
VGGGPLVEGGRAETNGQTLKRTFKELQGLDSEREVERYVEQRVDAFIECRQAGQVPANTMTAGGKPTCVPQSVEPPDVGCTVGPPARPGRFTVTPVTRSGTTILEVLRLLARRIDYVQRFVTLRQTPIAGPGRIDAFNGVRALLFERGWPLTAPVRYPPLWGARQRRWVHYDANTNTVEQRNLGQALGLGAVFVEGREELSTLRLNELSAQESVTQKLQGPEWPEDLLKPLDRQMAQRGEQLYVERCKQCHEGTPVESSEPVPLEKIGTDPNRVTSFNEPLGNQPFVKTLACTLQNLQNKALQMNLPPQADREVINPSWRTTQGYSARPLKGIWAAAPYLHNGSVPTLHALLQPANDRPKCFRIPGREFDPDNVGYRIELSPPAGTEGSRCVPQSLQDAVRADVWAFWFDATLPGNLNAGHEYSADMTEAQRRDLLEYLKTL